MAEYYVYAFVRKDGSPYYIGKGSGDRINTKRSNSRAKLPPKNQRVFIERNLTEVGALAIERRLIRFHGRKDFEEGGVLYNTTLGGEGVSGLKHTEETRKKMSVSHTGKKCPKSKEHREKISKSLKGRKRDPNILSEEGRKKISDAKKAYWEDWHKNNTKKIFVYERKGRARQSAMMSDVAKKRNTEQAVCPHCSKEGQRINMIRWHFDNCKMKDL